MDTPEHLAACFDFDWNCSKLSTLIKPVKDKHIIYEYLKSNYQPIRETYKYMASLGPSGNVFSIGMNVFSDVIYNCEGVLGDGMKLADVDLKFVATKAGGGKVGKGRNNPDRQLIRY